MPRKTIEVLGTAGVVRDTPVHKLADGVFSDARNIRFAESGAESLVGDRATFSGASITPLWIGFFPPLNAPIWVYGNLTEMWAVDNTTHTEITRTDAPGDYSGVASERWQSAVLNGVGIFNNTIDPPQAWLEFSPTTKLVDLPNWDSTRRCKSLRSFKNYLIALNMTDSGVNRPYRVVWSDSAVPGTVPGSWDTTDPATDAREFDLAETSDHLVDQLILGDINIIYKETSTWGMQFIGPPFYFRFWKILSRHGLLARDCMASAPFGHVVTTQDDIIIHSGQTEQTESILDSRMRRWLFSTIDPANFKNCFMMTHKRRNEVYFCFPELGQVYANRALVWNWKDSSIGIRDMNSTPFGAVGPVGQGIDDDKEWG